MRKNYLFVISALIAVMGLSSCQVDEAVNTTELDGNWFVNRIEMINATSLDSENYQVVNSKDYDAYNLVEGSLLFVVKETSNFNEYFVTEYKYAGSKWVSQSQANVNSGDGSFPIIIRGSKWVSQSQANVRLSGDNKFTFNGRQCKFKKGKGELLEIKAKYGSEFYRYRLEKTPLKP